MITAIKNCRIWQEDGTFRPGTLYVHGERLCAPAPADTTVDAQGQYVCPGLVDLHTHGCAGFDFTTADQNAWEHIAAHLAARGVTSFLATLASDQTKAWQDAIALCEHHAPQGCIGVHLEGRWLAHAKRGAHAISLLSPPTGQDFAKFFSPVVRRVTYAPELDADGSFAAACECAGVRRSIGHTEADYTCAMTALAGGADCFTHLGNAMPPLHHRAGGAVAAALTTDAFAELICDGNHIAPEMVRLFYQSKGTERLLLVSDSMAGTDCPDGDYPIAGQIAHLKNGRALTDEGTLAGSTLSLLTAVQNLAAFCAIPFGKALLCATRTPAAYMGLTNEIGSLREGAFADILFLRTLEDKKPCRVMRHGTFLLLT